MLRAFPVLQSFSELFVNFLEKESSPQPQVKLPAERMIREEEQRWSSQSRSGLGAPKHKPSTPFNPFAAPMHAAMPLQLPATGSNPRDVGHARKDSSHLLMEPISSALPMFTPMNPAGPGLGGGLLPVGGAEGPGPGRGSGQSSGRSTPATSGTILRDVLQQ